MLRRTTLSALSGILLALLLFYGGLTGRMSAASAACEGLCDENVQLGGKNCSFDHCVIQPSTSGVACYYNCGTGMLE
ncbi:MAG TPA: hypothetical protein VF546_09435 [Pyrinomonadaceae bacterium]|jgi:hypothetical protein